MANILVVDDEESICFAFSQCIRQMGHTPFCASSSTDARILLEEADPRIVFLDIRLPGESGLTLLETIKRSGREVPVVIMTAFGTMDTAIEAVKTGAYDYLNKPVDLREVQNLIRTVLRAEDTQILRLDGTETDIPGPDSLVGSSDAISDIHKMIGLLITNPVPVLIEGETGVGKELVARTIHNRSDRREAPFVAVNCTAMDGIQLESELFGHEKGAFAGAESVRIGKLEAAGRGTLFLDEIGGAAFPVQVRLLQAIQEKILVRMGGRTPIPLGDVRFITASGKNLYEEMKEGRFRGDLYYRLQVITLKIPPLRQRKEDIPALVSHFIRKGNREMNIAVQGIEKKALDLLMNHHWPGNIRELENVIKRGQILARTDVISCSCIELTRQDAGPEPGAVSDEDMERHVQAWFEAKRQDAGQEDHLYASLICLAEKSLIRSALASCSGNQLRTSELLGMNRTTLRNKIREFGL